MTAEILKLPYSVSRRVVARRPRRSKNGTPEERAAKAAALTAAAATVVNVSPRRKPADLKVHCSVDPDPNVPLTPEEFRSIVEQMNPLQLARLQRDMEAVVAESAAESAAEKKKMAKRGAAPKLVATSDPPGAA